MTYRPGRSARSMYRHKSRHGTAGMSKRQLRALAREMDIGVNPKRHRGHRSKPRSRREGRRGYTDSESDRSFSYPTMSRRDKQYRKMVGKRYSKRSRRMPPSYRRMRASEAEYRLRNPLDGLHEDVIENVINGMVNPYKGRYYTGRKSTRSAWNPKGASFEAKVRAELAEARAALSRDSARAYSGSRHHSLKRRVEQLEAKLAQVSKRRNPVLMNPKRDGSMTKGEKRLQKHAEWLREIAERGRKATAMLKGMRTVPAASHVAAAEHAADKLNSATIEKAMEGVPAAVAKVETVVEHAEAAFIKSRIHDISELISDLERDIEKADAAGEDAEAEELMDQKIKLAKQRTDLKAKATGLGIQMNPRPRSRRRTVLVGTRAYARALHDLKAALRRRPSRLAVW